MQEQSTQNQKKIPNYHKVKGRKADVAEQKTAEPINTIESRLGGWNHADREGKQMARVIDRGKPPSSATKTRGKP